MKGSREVAYMVTAPVKGYMADNERGHVLWKQGYGKHYDSAQSIARAGKSGYKRK